MNTTELKRNDTTTANDLLSVSREALIVTEILLCALGFASNGLIVYGYARFRQLRTLTNYFVFNLAIADLSLNVSLLVWVLGVIHGNFGILYRAVMVNINVLCFSASMLNLAAVSIDRYLAVTDALKYKRIFTRSRARNAAFLIWVYSLIMSGVGVTRFFVDGIKHFNKIYITVLTAASFVIPATVMIFTHLSIFRVAWSAKKRTRNLQEMSHGRCEQKAAKTKLSLNILIILVPMVTAWGIFYTITVVEAYCSTCYTPAKLSVVTGLLPYGVAAIDPIIYIFVTRSLRRKLCKLCR